MKLETVIQTILQSKNFITIPGLGSFVSQYHPARIVKSDYVKFIPPQKILVFNALVQQDDGILVSVLQTDYKLSAEAAYKEVERFVSTTKEILQSSNIVNLNGIGTLYYNNQAIEFEPAPISVDSSVYGLSDFSVHTIPQEARLQDFVKKKKSELPLHKKIIKATFILSPVLFGALLIPNIIHAPQMTGLISIFRDTDAYVDFSIPRKPIPVLEYKKTEPLEIVPSQESTKTEVKQESETKLPESSDKAELPKTISYSNTATTKNSTPSNQSKNTTYYIIVGSYSNEKNAQQFLSSIQSTHKNAGILIKDGKIRVYLQIAENKKSATNNLLSIKQQNAYKQAWIYTEKV